jgi:hypothetical protein
MLCRRLAPLELSKRLNAMLRLAAQVDNGVKPVPAFHFDTHGGVKAKCSLHHEFFTFGIPVGAIALSSRSRNILPRTA